MVDNCEALVTDDDHVVTELVKALLEQQGYNVHTASSGEQALEIYARTSIDIVLTDIQMGGMSGFELIRQLRLINSAVKVIVMTSHDSYETVLKALQHGAYDYLQKPFTNHATIIAAAQRALDSAKLQQRNNELMQQLRESYNKLATANRELRGVNKKLKHLAATDSLTSLYNRRYFDEILKHELNRHARYQTGLSIIMIDVDRFKEFNDTFGHAAGDLALKQSSSIFKACARAADTICRYGGEEFVALLPQTSPENAIVFAERVRTAIESTPVKLEHTTAKITISLGISGTQLVAGPINGETLMARADRALYQAKRAGRNCYVLESESDHKKAA
ncbi:hypothetical protein AB833_10220 [Chromatiales bacterium (ex Bugula neritina AB1)]|nr:hypothetical protein AB833_10220 [Chromatiales bacterium (ex Bugula neritina AB1)]